MSKSPDTPKKRIYFPGLNALRFIASAMVIFHHCEQYMYWADLPSSWGEESIFFHFIDGLGHRGLSLFFVLSGFLITYLLLAEKERTGDIKVKQFYGRRMLRIWPVYFLVTAIAFFVLPSFVEHNEHSQAFFENFWPALLLYLFVLPNFIRATPVHVMGANQAWSIGVEEQFYIIWPFLVRKFAKNLARFLVVFIVLKYAIQIGAYAGIELLPGKLGMVSDKFYVVWKYLQIEQMAMGAFAAWFYFKNSRKALDILYAPITQVVAYGLFVFSFFVSFDFAGHTLVEGFMFAVIILNVSTNKKSPVKMASKRFDLLGNLSYGMYMYHTMVTLLLIQAFKHWGLEDNMTTFSILLNLSTLIVTMIIAYLSYTYFEKYFLKLKEKLMVVKSTTSTD